MNTKRFLLAMGAVLMLSLPMTANKWDVTGDGQVTAADITAVYNKLLSNDTNYPESAYDVNGDGNVTAGDITALYDVLLGGYPSNIKEYTVNGVSFMMVIVEGGTFAMGADSSDSDAEFDESPVHNVTLGHFSIGQTEVTQELWQAVMGNNPSSNVGANNPVENVSWDDCQEFITRLNQMTGEDFRFPTEAEWEYAARGGNKSHGYLYAGSNLLDNVGWFKDNCSASQCVAGKVANELSLFDMSGNVWEWCSDWYGGYSTDAQDNPEGPTAGIKHVLRGGSWYGKAKKCRVSERHNAAPDFRDDDMGLRLARSVDYVVSITGEMLNNSVDIVECQSVNVSNSTINLKWNMSKSKMSLNYTVAVTPDNTATVSLINVPIVVNNTYQCYTFSAANAGNGVTNLTGYYRPATGCLYIEFIANGTYQVMSSAKLYYPYLNYNITNSDTGASTESRYGAMAIYINPKNMSANLAMGDLALSENSGTIMQMVFYGLHVEPTATGYHITYSGDLHSTDGNFVLNAFDAIISDSGKEVSGTFTLNGNYNGIFNGKAFAN